MTVVHVGRVLVLVRELVMLVRVRMLAVKGRVVHVIVVVVVVPVRVIVIDGIVAMKVPMPLGQMEPQAHRERDRGERRGNEVPAVAQRQAERGADERRDRKD